MAKIEIDHILCPMDFSAQSQQAYSYAVALARWYDARITALHVVAMRPAVEAIPSIYGAILPPAASDELKRALAGDLERCVRTADAAGLQVDVRVLEAPLVHQEVLAQARLLDSDLIVISTHGLRGLDRLVLGSVTEKVLRNASAPVLVIPSHSAPEASQVRFKRILCPIDFSAGSQAGLSYALSLAEEADAELTLLHVIDNLATSDLVLSSRDVEVTKQGCAEDLQRLIPAEARTYCSIDVLVSEGRPAREILNAATARGTELIVMGVQGRNAFDRLFFGSNTHAVIRAANCPVLTVRCLDKARSRDQQHRLEARQ